MNQVPAVSKWAKRMAAKSATRDQILPLAAGIAFLAVVVAALRLCAGSWEPVAVNSPEEDYRLALHAAMTPSPDWASYALYKLDHPTVFVTWTTSQWVPSFQKKASTDDPIAGTDLWVTDAA